jgi:ribosome-binding factor A
VYKSIKSSRKEAVILTAIQETFLYEVNEWFTSNILITVTGIELYKNNRIVQVYLSFLPNQEGTKLMQMIKKYSPKIRAAVHKKLANKLHTMPTLKFSLDDAIERNFFIQKLLSGYGMRSVGLAARQ